MTTIPLPSPEYFHIAKHTLGCQGVLDPIILHRAPYQKN